MPTYENIINGIVPSGDNVGQCDITIVSIGGSFIIAQEIEYERPTQEGVIGQNVNIKLDVTDPIIKDKV